ncbi:hypothetical protein BCR44DRAFT_44957 [Catenaria anguillulae PL171]|uniref:Uncharacterized protein n=1 Tax=Catenaria anguillulae PL171 TaxID=765915 RepID=A0A1Y2HUA8_9FUNG|nr:hypothetical protein BCR44DRAFT_44957 [Catenaria anguillulae PL171]
MRVSTLLVAVIALFAATTAHAAPVDVDEQALSPRELEKRGFCPERRACRSMCHGDFDCQEWCDSIHCDCPGKKCN